MLIIFTCNKFGLKYFIGKYSFALKSKNILDIIYVLIVLTHFEMSVIHTCPYKVLHINHKYVCSFHYNIYLVKQM